MHHFQSQKDPQQPEILNSFLSPAPGEGYFNHSTQGLFFKSPMRHFPLLSANVPTSSFRKKTDESGMDGNFVILQQTYKPSNVPMLQLQRETRS